MYPAHTGANHWTISWTCSVRGGYRVFGIGNIGYQRMYPTPKQHTAARPHHLLGYRWWVVRISMMMKGRTVVCWERQRDTGRKCLTPMDPSLLSFNNSFISIKSVCVCSDTWVIHLNTQTHLMEVMTRAAAIFCEAVSHKHTRELCLIACCCDSPPGNNTPVFRRSTLHP